MLLQYNMRGLFIRNYRQLDFSLTHVLIDTAKLEFRGWDRAHKGMFGWICKKLENHRL